MFELVVAMVIVEEKIFVEEIFVVDLAVVISLDDGVWMILRDQGENDQEEILKGRVECTETDQIDLHDMQE